MASPDGRIGQRGFVLGVALLPLLVACASTGEERPVKIARSAAEAPPRELLADVRPPAKTTRRQAEVHMMPGLERVIGASQADLTRQFGTPRLETWEGDARKLQFSGVACVLDVYLYPSPRGNEPTATFVDARRASDGAPVDRATCAGALRPPAPTVPAAAPSVPAKAR